MTAGKDEREKLVQADEWLTSPEASTDQKIAAREHVMFVVQHSENHWLRQRAMSIVTGTGMLR
jgi:hypothetical protein